MGDIEMSSTASATEQEDASMREGQEDEGQQEQGSRSQQESQQSQGSDDGGRLLECPICLQSAIHPVELPCQHIFCFLCIKGVAMQGQSRCAICRSQFDVKVLTHPRLKDVSQLYKHTKSEYEWFYEARSGGWWQYDERTAAELDRAYDGGQTNCQLLIAGHLYDIDFSQMMQSRSNNRNLQRRIKRDVISAERKGVAGIRLGQGQASATTAGGDSNPPSNGRRRGGPSPSAPSQNDAAVNGQTPPLVSRRGNDQLDDAPSDDEGDEGVDSDDSEYSEDDEDEMDLGEEEELEESEPEVEDNELRDGARAPTRRSDRSDGRATTTPNSGTRSCSSSSPSNGVPSRRSSGRSKKNNGRSSRGTGTPANPPPTTASIVQGSGDTSSSASTSPSPQLLGEIRTLASAGTIRLSPAPSGSAPALPGQMPEESLMSQSNIRSLSPRVPAGSSITTSSGITCLLIGPGVRITVDRNEQPLDATDEDEVL